MRETVDTERRDARPSSEPEAAASDTPMLDTFGTDLTALARAGELDPVIGRDDEIEQTIEILSRRTKNNPVLVGEAGVGKTAIVEGLARRSSTARCPSSCATSASSRSTCPAMLAGTRYRGDFEERLTKTMDEIAAHKGELIVFIDEVHTVVGAGGGGDGGDGCRQHPEAAPRPRRPAPRRRDHAQGVPRRSRRTPLSSAGSSRCASASRPSRTPC